MELDYSNTASEKTFISDFKIVNGNLSDKKLRQNLKKAVQSKSSESFLKTRNSRHYTMTVVFVEGQSYINIYANDISNYVNEVNRKEVSLLDLKNKNSRAKNYEFILNNLPADIAVFNDHNYVFINPKGIRDDKIREYMIGKNDFDYYKLKNLPDDKTRLEEKYLMKFQREKFINWTDEFKKKDGDR